MTYKASAFCPYCHRYTALSVVRSIYGGDYLCVHQSEKDKKYWWMGICNNCGELCLVYDNGVRVYPNPQPSLTDDRILNVIIEKFQGFYKF